MVLAALPSLVSCVTDFRCVILCNGHRCIFLCEMQCLHCNFVISRLDLRCFTASVLLLPSFFCCLRSCSIWRSSQSAQVALQGSALLFQSHRCYFLLVSSFRFFPILIHASFACCRSLANSFAFLTLTCTQCISRMLALLVLLVISLLSHSFTCTLL